MRLCFLMHHGSMYSGGQGVYLHYLTRELSRLGHEVHVIAGPPYPVMAEGVQVHRLESFSWFHYLEARQEFLARANPLEFFYPLNLFEFATTRAGIFPLMFTFSLRALAKFQELHRREPFDLVHDNQSLGIGLLLIKSFGVPVVATIHHPLSVDVRNAVAQAKGPIEKARRLIYYPIFMQEFVARRLDKIITVSEASASMVERAFDIPRAQMKAIYNGIDTEIFRPLKVSKEPNNVIYVGNSEDRSKGAAYLLRALRILRDSADYRLTFVDRPRQGLKLAPGLVRRYGLSTRVRFTGRLTTAQLVRHYCRAQMMVCPSLYEGFGLPVAEAMACGLPVVATTGGALPEVVEDGVSGLLVPPGDALALAEAMRSLMEDAQLRRRLGQAGRQRVVEKFSWRKAALETEAVYAEVCPDRSGATVPAAAAAS
ncbi:MAG: glycosyltransferase family 4 protein [Chloroflexota bacterium]|nr:glycosyltransferase family 4 protein [Chloroflexota bacterium]